MWQGAREWKRVRPVLLANWIEGVEEFAEVAESLFIAVMLLAGFVLLVAMNAQGKARAFEDGDASVPGQRPPEAVTDVELPSPQFNRRDPETRRGK